MRAPDGLIRIFNFIREKGPNAIASGMRCRDQKPDTEKLLLPGRALGICKYWTANAIPIVAANPFGNAAITVWHRI